MASPVTAASILEKVMAASSSCSVHERQNRFALVLHQEDQELRRRRGVCVLADNMNVVRSFVKGLARGQRDGRPTPDLHEDRALQYVDQRLRVMRMHRIRCSG